MFLSVIKRLRLACAVWGLLVAAGLFPVWCGWGQGFDLNDDAYITLTYAKNLAAGRGFVFNHPPPTFGTTTPLFALLVAGLAALVRQVPVDVLAVWITVLAWLAAGWTFWLFRQAWHLDDRSARMMVMAVLLGGWVGPMGVLGSEVFLFHALLILTLSLHLAGKAFPAGIAAGLLFLTRGEGVLVLGSIGLSLWYCRLFSSQDKTSPGDWQAWANGFFSHIGRLLAGFILVLMVWTVYAYRTFGQVLPATLVAKRNQVALGWPTFTHELLTNWWYAWGGESVGHPLLSLWWGLVAIGLVTALRERPRWSLFPLWLAGYTGGYAMLGVAGYWWYQVPVFLSLQILFALGLITCQEALERRFTRHGRRIGLALVICGLAWVLWPAARAVVTYDGDWRASSYRTLAAWLQLHARPTDRVAFHEVGYLGFYSEQRIVDLCGLTTPEVLPHFARRDLTWPVRTLLPEWYVASPTWDILPALREGGWLERHYRCVAMLPAPDGGHLQIFQRLESSSNE
ncbi:MAG: hypothetical protein ACUVR8_02400 [Acidobacteriota bacterium]